MSDQDRIHELEAEIARLREHLQFIADEETYCVATLAVDVAEHALWQPGYHPEMRPKVSLIKPRKPEPLNEDQQALYDRMWLRNPLMQRLFDRSGSVDEVPVLTKGDLIRDIFAERSLAHLDALRASSLPVERIVGPIEFLDEFSYPEVPRLSPQQQHAWDHLGERKFGDPE